MKLRIRVEGEGLGVNETGLEAIEKRIRLALGTRAVSIEAVDLTLAALDEDQERVRCRLALRHAGGLQTFVEEDAKDPLTAAQWVVWRMVHFLDRRALREN